MWNTLTIAQRHFIEGPVLIHGSGAESLDWVLPTQAFYCPMSMILATLVNARLDQVLSEDDNDHPMMCSLSDLILYLHNIVVAGVPATSEHFHIYNWAGRRVLTSLNLLPPRSAKVFNAEKLERPLETQQLRRDIRTSIVRARKRQLRGARKAERMEMPKLAILIQEGLADPDSWNGKSCTIETGLHMCTQRKFHVE